MFIGNLHFCALISRFVAVSNLHMLAWPAAATEEDLRELMSACGEVDNVRIVRDPATQMGKGFASVCFKVRALLSLTTLREKLVLTLLSVRAWTGCERCQERAGVQWNQVQRSRATHHQSGA